VEPFDVCVHAGLEGDPHVRQLSELWTKKMMRFQDGLKVGLDSPPG